MGTSSSVTELVGKIDKAAGNVERSNKVAVAACAQRLTAAANAGIAAATGGDGYLSGMGRSRTGKQRGRIVAVHKTTTAAGQTAAIVKVLGPAPLIERDVAPHYVFPKGARAGGRKTRTKSYKNRGGTKTNANIASAYGNALGPESVDVGTHRLHFGDQFLPFTVAWSKGRHPWEHAETETVPTFPAVFAKAQTAGLVEAFR